MINELPLTTPRVQWELLNEQKHIWPATIEWLRSEDFKQITSRWGGAPDSEAFDSIAKAQKLRTDKRFMPALDFFASDSEKHPGATWLIECRVRFGWMANPNGKGHYEATLKQACGLLSKHATKYRMAYPEDPFRAVLVVPTGVLGLEDIQYCHNVAYVDVHEIFFPQVFHAVAPLLQGGQS